MNYFLGIDRDTGVLAADFEECARTQTGCPATTFKCNPGWANFPVKGSTVIQNDIWYHAAVTFDGRYWKLYLDGALESMTAGADTGSNRLPRWDSIQHAGIGIAMNSTGVREGFFDGVLDETRIWNIVRTPEQISAAVNQELTSGAGLGGPLGT